MGEATSTQSTRPMTLGEILSRTLRIYRTNWRVFLLLGLIIAVISSFETSMFTIWLHFHPRFLLATYVTHSTQTMLVARISTIIVSIFAFILRPSLVLAAVNTITGHNKNLTATLHAGLQKPLQLLTLILMLVSIIYVFTSIPFFLFAGWVNIFKDFAYSTHAAKLVADFLILIAYVFEYALIFFFIASFELSMTAFVMEKQKPFSALKRGWALASEGRLRLGVIYILLFAAGLAGLYLERLFVYVILKIFPVLHTSLYGIPLKPQYQYLAIIPVTSILAPLFPIALTLIYFDQRIRQEDISFAEILHGPALDATTSADAERITSDTTPDFSPTETPGAVE